MSKTSTPLSASSVDLSAIINAAVKQAVAEVLGGLGAAPVAPAPVTAPPVAPAPRKAKVKLTWAERGQDKVVQWLDANGMPRNQYGMTIKRDEAIYLGSAVEAKIDLGERAKVATAARARVGASVPIRTLLLDDGAGWLHCPECSAYWSARRDDAWLAGKYRKHLRSPQHAGK